MSMASMCNNAYMDYGPGVKEWCHTVLEGYLRYQARLCQDVRDLVATRHHELGLYIDTLMGSYFVSP